MYPEPQNGRALADMLAPHRGVKPTKTLPRPSLESQPGPEATDEHGSSVVVLPSSTELFYFYGQSLEQCAKLSTGKALFELSGVHKKWLRIYAGRLMNLILHSRVLSNLLVDRGNRRCAHCQHETVGIRLFCHHTRTFAQFL